MFDGAGENQDRPMLSCALHRADDDDRTSSVKHRHPSMTSKLVLDSVHLMLYDNRTSTNMDSHGLLYPGHK